ncbi:hypothetical protein EVAR_94526_1 [Eumeta japonica]|uniref:Uncharacterized protein n=1 Tax=Eumeta variegata TaxID=151549 RepID=A0A4C1UUV0_EUMVA|nr:hypothetical protein EVAR_94526_1 [Eumeta japonica]
MCLTLRSGVTILEDPGSIAGARKHQRESPGDVVPAIRSRRKSERRKDNQGEEAESTGQALRITLKEELLNRQRRTYASALKLASTDRVCIEIKKSEGGPVLAIYPVSEQEETIKSAEDAKKILKNTMYPISMQIQATKVRKRDERVLWFKTFRRIGEENQAHGAAHPTDNGAA